MATKKEPSIDDALKYFKDVIQRASLTNYVHYNGKLISKNPKGKSILIIPEKELWVKIKEESDISNNITELDINDKDYGNIISMFECMDNLDDNSWIDVDIDNLYKGNLLKVSIKDFEYQVPINKNMIPLKLKKSEFTDIKYKVFIKPLLVLGIKKKFPFPIEGYSFSIIRLFKII